MKRAAAVDIGTNSTRLLIADVNPGAGVLADIERRAQVTALGRGVDRTGRLTPGAVERTTRVLESYGRLIRAAGAEASRAAAASAARDAANGAEFLDAASAALGFRPEIIDGGEEAALVFMGAAGRSADSCARNCRKRYTGGQGKREVAHMLSRDVRRLSAPIQRAFWSGAAQSFDLFGLCDHGYPPSETEADRKSDQQALADDWNTVIGGLAEVLRSTKAGVRSERASAH